MCVCACVCVNVCACVCAKCCSYNPQKKRAGWPTKKKIKKRQKIIQLSEAVSLPNEVYFYEGKHSDSNTFFIIVHNIFTPENETSFSCS